MITEHLTDRVTDAFILEMTRKVLNLLNKPDALEYGTFAAVSLRIWQTGQQNL